MRPLIDEIVYYTKVIERGENVTLKQVMTLMEFGHTYDVKDSEYWRNAVSLVEKILTTAELSAKVTDDKFFSTVTYLKQFGLLTNPILRSV